MISKPRNSGWGSNSFCLIYFLSNLSLVLVVLLLLLVFWFAYIYCGLNPHMPKKSTSRNKFGLDDLILLKLKRIMWKREETRSRKTPRSKTKPRLWFWNWFRFVRSESGTKLRDLWSSDLGFVLVLLVFFIFIVSKKQRKYIHK